MINTFFLVGEIKKITVSEPKDPKKNASAVLLIQYGPQRELTNKAVEFVNAALVRIPSYRFPALRNRLRVGQTVQVIGRIQGVYKHLGDQGFFTVELVTDRIDVHQEAKGDSEPEEPAESEATADAE